VHYRNSDQLKQSLIRRLEHLGLYDTQSNSSS